MTLREKLAKEHPKCVGPNFIGGCDRCPDYYGYVGQNLCETAPGEDRNTICARCWDQEIPEAPAKSRAEKIRSMTDEELADLLHSAAFYCKEHAGFPDCPECQVQLCDPKLCLEWLQQPAKEG